MELAIFYLTLFLLGAAHALEPGHGKLLVTSYLTGSQAKTRDALLLGILVAVFHTLSVGLIGGLVVFLAFTVFKASAAKWLEILSGGVILLLGILLVWRRFFKESPAAPEHCDCHLLHSTPVATEQKVRPQSSLGEVVLLALASGLTPCPTALAALIAAFAVGKTVWAIGSLAVFSAGIGSVLVVLGLSLIKGADTLKAKWSRFEQAPLMIARVSTVIVLLLGCYLVAKPLLMPDEDNHMEALNFLMPLHYSGAHSPGHP